jgi:hypothetical protein
MYFTVIGEEAGFGTKARSDCSLIGLYGRKNIDSRFAVFFNATEPIV